MKILSVIIGCMLNVVNYGRSSPIPETILVQVGSEVVLPCPAPGKGTVLWQYDALTTSIPREIYVSKIFINGYVKRCRLTGSATSFNDLVISNVSSKDAGGYICIEANGIGQSHYLILKVEGEENTFVEPTKSSLNPPITTFSWSSTFVESTEASATYNPNLAYVVIPIFVLASISLVAVVLFVLRRKVSQLQMEINQTSETTTTEQIAYKPIEQEDDYLSKLPIALLETVTKKSARCMFLKIRSVSANAGRLTIETIASINKDCLERVYQIRKKAAKTFKRLNRSIRSPLPTYVNLCERSEVSCFTKYLDYICVIRGKSRELLLFGNKEGNYALQHKCRIDIDMDPLGLTANRQEECLFVSDRKNKCVWKINVSQKKQSWNFDFQKWLETREVTTISVLSYESLVVLLNVTEPVAHKECQGSMDFYDMDARLVRRTPLPTDLKSPTCIAPTNHGTYLVAFVGGVCEVKLSGEEVMRYTSEMKFPIHIKAEPQLENVFVVDVETGKIWQINNTLRLKLLTLQLPTKQVLNNVMQDVAPMRVCCDEEKNELIIGLENGEIRVYSRKPDTTEIQRCCTIAHGVD